MSATSIQIHYIIFFLYAFNVPGILLSFVGASLEYNIFRITGVSMELHMIRRITDVKYLLSISPTASPFCDTMRATSPLVIIPTPILSVSLPLKPNALPARPQPTIFESIPVSTNARENRSILISRVFIFV